jgi:GTPase SAR1 family protein
MRIVSADERLSESRGVKMLIAGPTAVGKTSLLRTLSSSTTLFIDVEAGDLAVQDWVGDAIRVDDWPTARDLACRIGGPNPSFPPTAAYSEAHHQAIGGALENLDRYQTIFVDSITAVSGSLFGGPSSNLRLFQIAPARRIRGAPTGFTGAKCSTGCNSSSMLAASM